MKHWFERQTSDADTPEMQAFRELFRLRMPLPNVRLSDVRQPVRATMAIARALRQNIRARRARVIVMKDPIALLSADWLVRHFSVFPIVMIRHPAAFVSSLRMRGWFFDFNNFLAQPTIIDEFFPEERDNIEKIVRNQYRDIIAEGAFQWRLLNKVILNFREKHPEWIYVRHEDISRDPLGQFAALFGDIGMPFTAGTKRFLLASTHVSDHQSVTKPVATSDVTRNSVENVYSWKRRLNGKEIETIRDIVEQTCSHLYSDSEW